MHGDEFDMGLLGFDAGELERAMGLQAELDGGAEIDEGISYQENFAVLVQCEDEAGQQAAFERLTTMGYTCKVLVN